MNEEFNNFCETGNLNDIIKHINTNKIDIHMEDDGFRLACYYGHKHILKYLIKLHKIQPTYAKININVNNDSGFITACNYKHKYIIKYLLSCGCHSNNYKCIIVL